MDKFKSRKFWIAIVTAVLLVVNDQFGIGFDEQTVTSVVTVVVGYILGQGAVDAAKVYSGNKAIAEVEAARFNNGR